jgi:hypothetical protein
LSDRVKGAAAGFLGLMAAVMALTAAMKAGLIAYAFLSALIDRKMALH